MIDPNQSRAPYILFDLNGQNVGVLEAGIDDTGRLKCSWVCIDKVRKFSDEQIEAMLHDAFKCLLTEYAEQQNET